MGFYTKMKAERIAKTMGLIPKYRVLQAELLKLSDKEKVVATLASIRNVADAHQLAGRDGFAYKDLFGLGGPRAGIILYKGVEVAILFKREIVEMEPGPADPVPQNTIEDPMAAWIQVDLMDTTIYAKRKGTSDRLQQTLDQVERLQMLWQNSEREKAVAMESLGKTSTLREEHHAFREKIALMEKEREVTIKEIEGLQLTIKKERDERRGDKLKMVAEMFPVFNTVWLAELHRVGDTLYGILKKQLVEVLTKIGVALVEPKVGDEFDPVFHHAIHAKAYPKDAPEIGTVVEVFRFGWKLANGPVYSAADVAVGVEEKNGATNDSSASGAKEVS